MSLGFGLSVFGLMVLDGVAVVSWLKVGCLWSDDSGLLALGSLFLVSWLWVECLWSLGSGLGVSGLLALGGVAMVLYPC